MYTKFLCEFIFFYFLFLPQCSVGKELWMVTAELIVILWALLPTYPSVFFSSSGLTDFYPLNFCVNLLFFLFLARSRVGEELWMVIMINRHENIFLLSDVMNT